MPTPGPVAYHVQSAFLTLALISFGSDHVTPSSLLCITQTVRPPLLVPSRICDSLSSPRFRVVSSQIVPLSRSTTGQGLPNVPGPLSPIIFSADQVAPPSVLRLT